ncbi:Gldg family protein [Kordiimonas sp. SCSIO 12603]|uniref:Gldg family protein n=1 Tax=Kordiimonas sp. SCSIO 12603 TaxID=2829596 RepID=UPI0021028E3E|nr:Gldg family protein [Kordiimonas sp. SCSIO 12603]UTW59437.1 Gldg family protein [Kordiimonas sp. SCSIO 12603]
MSKLLSRTSIQFLLAVLMFLSVTVLADRYLRAFRVDLTEGGLYTLTEGTETLLAETQDSVSMEFYFSRTLATPYPQLLNYGKRVEDMLRAFSVASSGQITLSIIDPKPFSEEEDDAVAAGLKGIPMGDGSVFYLGLKVANDLDGEAIIPFFTEERENFLEYDLVKLLASLGNEDKKTLALLTSLPMQFGAGGAQAALSGQGQPYVIYQQLQEFFDVSMLAADFTALPDSTDVLLVVHPPVLTDDQLFAIDQFVLSGGRALVFLDPHSEAMDPRAVTPQVSNLGPLLKAWGAEMPEGMVVGDASLAQRVQVGGYGPDSIKDYLFWLGIKKDFLSADDIVAGSVDNLNLASSGVLLPVEGASTRFDPLVSTSAVAMLYDAQRATGQPDPDALLGDFVADGNSYALVARLTGAAKTAFPEKAEAGISDGTINIVVGADVDLFEDRFWVQLQELLGQRIVVPLAGNGSFILNLADHISGSDSLLELRGRGVMKRPFGVVDRLRKNAEAKYLAEERILQERLQVAEQRIAELEAQQPEGSTVFSSEQEAEIDSFRDQLLETRKELRTVNRNLHEEIDGLGKLLAFINIAFVPIIIVLFVLLRLFIRRRRAVV